MERYLIGTYTRDVSSLGIYYLVCNTKTGNHKIVSTSERMVENPIYTTMNQDKDVIYSIIKDAARGGIATLSLEDDNFSLYEEEEMDGFGACDILLTPNEQFILTAHYGAGKVVVEAVDGTAIDGVVQVVDHKLYEEEGQVSHVHFVEYMSDGHILVCDLGLDRIYSYPFDMETGILDLENKRFFTTKSGSGPRNLAVSRDEKIVYCINELSTTIDVYSYEKGMLTFIQSYDTVDTIIDSENEAKKSSGAAIKLSADETRLYVSIRGNNELAVFSVQKENLERIANIATEGEHPRDFSLSEKNDKIFVANQLSNNLTVFNLDDDGIPIFSGESIEIPSPVHVLTVE